MTKKPTEKARKAAARLRGPGLATFALIVLVGCGGDGGGTPVEPTPQYPQVAATYAGPVVITLLATGETIVGTGQAVVVQAGNQLTINSSMTIAGVEVALAAVTGTINETGFFTLTASGAVPGPPTTLGECGILTLTSASLTFAGRTLTYQESHNTTFCGSITLVATLTR